MKKLFVIFFIAFSMFLGKSDAAVVNSANDGEFQEYINKTGFRLLNCNQITQHLIFIYSPSKSVYGSSDEEDMSVKIPKGMLMHVESEDELAAIIAYQTAYTLMYKENKFAKLNIKTAPKKYEAMADKRAVDMLVRADYSPIALITVINKLYGDKKSAKHMKTSVRLAEIYEFILRKYPAKLDDEKFSKNIYYQNFLLTSFKNREILQNKLIQNSTETKNINYR